MPTKFESNKIQHVDVNASYINIYIYIYNKEKHKGVNEIKNKTPKNIHSLHQEDTVNIGYE